MHLSNIEKLEVHGLGGADNVTIGDLTGTGVKQVAIDLVRRRAPAIRLATAPPTASSSTAQPTMIASISPAPALASRSPGLPAKVNINGAEGANDTLTVKGGRRQ